MGVPLTIESYFVLCHSVYTSISTFLQRQEANLFIIGQPVSFYFKHVQGKFILSASYTICILSHTLIHLFEWLKCKTLRICPPLSICFPVEQPFLQWLLCVVQYLFFFWLIHKTIWIGLYTWYSCSQMVWSGQKWERKKRAWFQWGPK